MLGKVLVAYEEAALPVPTQERGAKLVRSPRRADIEAQKVKQANFQMIGSFCYLISFSYSLIRPRR